MSNYTRQHNFSVKDGLPSGNANKVIDGTDWDDELTAIATAIATKYDSSDTIGLANGGTSAATAAAARTALGMSAAATQTRDYNNFIQWEDSATSATTATNLSSQTYVTSDILLLSYNAEVDTNGSGAGGILVKWRIVSGSAVMAFANITTNISTHWCKNSGTSTTADFGPSHLMFANVSTGAATTVVGVQLGDSTTTPIINSVTDLQLRGILFIGA